MASTDGLMTRLLKILVGHLHAVDQVDVVAAALAVDVGQRPGLPERGAARAAGRNRHAVGQLRQLDELPAVERQLLDLAVVDDVADFGVGRLQQRRDAGDRDVFACAGRSGSVTGRSSVWPTCSDQSGARDGLEAVELDHDLVLADRQRRQEEPAAAVRPAFERKPTVVCTATTVAPGSTPPVGSRMTPCISPVFVWAKLTADHRGDGE